MLRHHIIEKELLVKAKRLRANARSARPKDPSQHNTVKKPSEQSSVKAINYEGPPRYIIQ